MITVSASISMKKRIHFLKSMLCGLALIGTSVFAQTYCFTAPEGYGAGVTGGGVPNANNTVTVTTSADFATELSGSKSIIIVSGTLTFTSQLSKSFSNKTIIGLPGARMVNNQQVKATSGILYISGGSNIIIRNIIFEGPGSWDVSGNDNLSIKGASRVWVDHCEFQDGIDDSFDITGLSDNITVSWCKFSHLKDPKLIDFESGGTADHRYSNLIGGGDTDSPSDGHYSITWQNCWWTDGNKDRMVRGRNVELHMINCYWSSQVAKNNISLTSGKNGCTCYVEGGIFAGTGKQAIMDIAGGVKPAPPADPFNFKFVDCFQADGVTLPTMNFTNGAVNAGTLTAPTYSYTVFSSTLVKDAVTNPTCGAGATLHVTTDGVVSDSVYSKVGIETNTLSTIKVYPTLVDNKINIDFPSNSKGDAIITVYTLDGQSAQITSEKIDGQQTVSIDMQSLKIGIYLIKIEFESNVITRKFIKK